ncbi:alpha/beta hydrolase family protein [Planotetraspora sp. A-T 1434]|uniref:alpha/beta hydrolase family protein n=1 Tax=Planotetraspora sp. A-T 1434 TaxID=2979219 RepID=UPI0021C2257B|nr:alpha/beta hydrolase family protein [Planotetraspora sp. A-T 1434]MCT9933641.1 alpha/beta hydrolase family protein [Planotetraspora sp. A-T 1434]
MSETVAAWEAFRRVSALATGHCADLDHAVRLMSAHAWVGGGAPRFAGELSRHRTALQSALEDALGAISGLLVRQGAPAPGMPAVRTSVTSMTAGPGPFRGVEVRAMTALVGSLEEAAGRLWGLAGRLHAELAMLCLPSGAAPAVARGADWAGHHARDLGRRLSRIQRAERDSSTRLADGVVPSGVIGFDLFEGFAADPGGAGSLLRRVAAGDRQALTALLGLQSQGLDPGLAARINAWWRSLPQHHRDDLVTAMPQGVGSLDGLPAAIRDRANRLFLSAEKARLLAESARLTREMARTAQPAIYLTLDAVSRSLKRIDIVEKTLALGGRAGYPPVLLLAFSHAGPGRLIVSWGDPDAADTTVTYVPGLGTRLEGFDCDIERARQLWQQCQVTSGKRRIASIAWLGYDAPQLDPGLITPSRSVAMGVVAAEGAGALAAFSDGLHAAHRPAEGARNVVLGHSYGSLVTGRAAVLRPGRLADDLIFVGSPGVGVEHASELGAGPGHVWVGEAGNDMVTYLGRFSADPGDSAFGARRFFVQRSLITQAHSNYWKPHSASLRNIARIVNGQYEELELPKPVDHPQLLMPELAPDLLQDLNR